MATTEEIEVAAEAGWNYVDTRTSQARPLPRLPWEKLPEEGKADQRVWARLALEAAEKVRERPQPAGPGEFDASAI
jgi:hypothetical protein